MEIQHTHMGTLVVAQLTYQPVDMAIVLLLMEILVQVVSTFTQIDLVILQAFMDLLEELQQT